MRVAITGMAGVTSLGSSWEEIKKSLQTGRSGVREILEWKEFKGLRSRHGAPVVDWKAPDHFTRKVTRTMGRAAMFATWAAEQALLQAGLLKDALLTNGDTGVAFGSCLGSAEGLLKVAESTVARSFEGIPASSFLQVMSHSAAANIALYFGLAGEVLPLCSACTSATQSIGAAYQAIQSGRQKIMIAGGTDELCVGLAALFDSMAASSATRDPLSSPRPFDSERNGIIIGEGAGACVLEEYEHARARGADIKAELIGYATNSNGAHITNPDQTKMQTVMRRALSHAHLRAEDIGVIHAHATGTELGDIAEGQATLAVFGSSIPVTALKGNFGHTLGACGAIELWVMVEMAREGWIAPIHNLVTADERCGSLAYVKSTAQKSTAQHVMLNTFAFGGVNTSLILKTGEPLKL